ncbi:ATP-binding protein [Fluviicola sp.]|jgi:hypothetical protein|uniref:ATP-binding protein n=1 Tax=Fluviicola sp. TaxID=1917219 RepID=UPI00282BA9D8|nr:ATP-binding protein [Fluviicola sp.]MDR0802321.1 ATP-binding protein [Fluviicola sp.]
MNRLFSVNNTFTSYQNLISFYNSHKDKEFDEIRLELDVFFAANMSAALGAILDKFSENLNDVIFDYIHSQIEQILLKNDFLTYYGRERIEDTNRTTIKYQRLKPTDGKYFKRYVIEELIDGHSYDLPPMSSGVKEKIVEAIYEIFVNAQFHSNTEDIYTCGQFFPNKNKIEFTIVDTGVGFKQKILERFGKHLAADRAIEWAVQDKNTTKQVTGGLGLAVLREFINMNKGRMQIISRDGFYQYDNDGVMTKMFNGEFPGTIVNLQFCTDDSNNYSLTGEIDENDIF